MWVCASFCVLCETSAGNAPGRACWSALMADEDVVPGPSLASIDPELQLLIFQSFRRGCATACLCQLEKTCKAFSTVAQLPSRAGNEDEGLSLPEIAARLLMARALALPVDNARLRPVRDRRAGGARGAQGGRSGVRRKHSAHARGGGVDKTRPRVVIGNSLIT